mmetsp:Transcript_2697/g.4296  ORF Transcript_2697/g.4296 Transcript_2697/m.4296 type:complete len:238 (+) Transcript_2697:135-848(+)
MEGIYSVCRVSYMREPSCGRTPPRRTLEAVRLGSEGVASGIEDGAHLLDGDVHEQAEGAKEHAGDNAWHDGQMRNTGLYRVQHEEPRGPQVEDDEVRPPGERRGGIREHAAQAVCGAERAEVDGEHRLGEQHVCQHHVQQGVRHGDSQSDGLGVSPAREEHQGDPRGEASQVARMQNLVVGEKGQKGDRTRHRNRRTLGFGGGERCARKREGEHHDANADGHCSDGLHYRDLLPLIH